MHLASTKPGRTGKGMWATLNGIASGNCPAIWSDTLEFELLYILALLRLPHERPYSLVPFSGQKLRVGQTPAFP